MAQLRVLTDDEIAPSVLAELRRLVVDVFAEGFTDGDWEHTFGGWRAVAFDGATPLAHAAVVPRELHVGDRPFRAGYLEGVATSPARQGQGLGALVTAEVTRLVRDHFEIGALSTSVHDFYRRFGWERWRGPSFVRVDDRRVRTPDEDDGLMVLRFGPSTAVDLTSSLSCEARSGDDW